MTLSLNTGAIKENGAPLEPMIGNKTDRVRAVPAKITFARPLAGC